MIENIRSYYMRRLYREAEQLFYHEPWSRHNYFEHFLIEYVDRKTVGQFVVHFENYSVAQKDSQRVMYTTWIHFLDDAKKCGGVTGAIACIFTEQESVPEKYSNDVEKLTILSKEGEFSVFFSDFTSGVPMILENEKIRIMSIALHNTNEYLRKIS